MQHPACRDQVEAAVDVPQIQEIAVQESDVANPQILRHARGVGETRMAQVRCSDPELRLAQCKLDGFVAGSATEHQGPGSGSERSRRLPVGQSVVRGCRLPASGPRRRCGAIADRAPPRTGRAPVGKPGRTPVPRPECSRRGAARGAARRTCVPRPGRDEHQGAIRSHARGHERLSVATAAGTSRGAATPCALELRGRVRAEAARRPSRGPPPDPLRPGSFRRDTRWRSTAARGLRTGARLANGAASVPSCSSKLSSKSSVRRSATRTASRSGSTLRLRVSNSSSSSSRASAITGTRALSASNLSRGGRRWRALIWAAAASARS